ncbi:fimbrial protein [Pseudomonas sp. BJa5]|uniref:fimbrial protein n=1 Tax=Pseudomonas sp. BJa5 TaxID=2936270 RepID=UPI0025594C1A|nr:fimbrial protein [Pseudomonas sp. BGr12]MDL2421117.1 fimbrial protein [Pseudomonas sp. BGr12]
MIFPIALPDFFATIATSKSRSHLAASALLLGALSNQALADGRTGCRYVNGSGPQTFYFNLPQRLVVNNDLPVDHVLFEQRVSGSRISLNCSRGWLYTHGFSSPMTYYSGDTYETSVSGIGVRLHAGDGHNLYLRWPRHSVAWPTGGTRSHTPQFTLSLIKTGHITPGTLRMPVELGHLTAASLTPSTLRLTNPQIEVVETNPTCSVDAGSKLIPVFLGNHPRAIFNGVNFTTPAVPFSIVLNCNGGAPGGSRYVRFAITDAHHPDNRTQALRLAPGAGAAGVGIRIQHRLNGATSTIALGSSLAAGTVYPGVSRHEIQLSAQYIQQVPSSQIREGPAPARAWFTITYN